MPRANAVGALARILAMHVTEKIYGSPCEFGTKSA
jgi:hypothetical protein